MSLLFWALLRSIIFSCIGNSFYKWFSKTKIGIWFDARLDKVLSKIMRKENVAREKSKQIDMFANIDNRNDDDHWPGKKL